jgi:transmembrane sensor
MSDALLSLAVLRAMTSTQAAALWIAKEERDEPLFEQWLDDSEDNRAAWRKAQLVWGLFEAAEDEPMIAAMARAARQVDADAEPPEVPAPANDRTWPKLLVAAVAVFMLATTLMFGVRGNWFAGDGSSTLAADKNDPLAKFGSADFVTGKGQKSIVDLPDGTRVTLAPESALDLAYVGGRRDLRLLRGRGYFDVAHDAAHPFAVEAAGRMITALGTRFDVNLKPGLVRVVLAQGSVLIGIAPGSRTSQAAVRLRPGQAFVADGSQPGKVSDTDVDDDLSWREGFAAFDNQPLSQVVRKLNQSTRGQIVIHDPKVAAMRITGQFRTGDIERFGRALALALPVRVVARGADRYEIVRRR